jgi:hypothetical protein
MNQLWQWHLAAKALERPEAYLTRITEVAKESVKGATLSKQATAAMKRDMTQFAQFTGKARSIPKYACTTEFER